MSKDSKIVLAVFVGGMVALGVFIYVLHVRFLSLPMQIASNRSTLVTVVRAHLDIR
jgi:hypothetical protein